MKNQSTIKVNPEMIVPLEKGILKIPIDNSLVTIIGASGIFNEKETEVNWDKLLNDEKMIIFFKSNFSIQTIVQELCNRGKNNMTEILIYGYDINGQAKMVTNSLKCIENSCSEAGISRLETFIVGNLTSFDKHVYFKSKPLWGRKIVTTRNSRQSYDLVYGLERLGANVFEFPIVEVKQINKYLEIKRVLEQIENYQWIIFGMDFSVYYFIAQLLGNNYDLNCLKKSKICALSIESVERLTDLGLDLHYIPASFDLDFDEVIDGLKKSGLNKEQPVLLITGAQKGFSLSEKLKELQIEVDFLQILKTECAHIDQKKLDQLLDFFPADIWIFNGPLYIKEMKNIWEKIECHLKRCKIAAMGSLTQKAVEAEGFSVDILPQELTISSLISAIVDYYGNQE